MLLRAPAGLDSFFMTKTHYIFVSSEDTVSFFCCCFYKKCVSIIYNYRFSKSMYLNDASYFKPLLYLYMFKVIVLFQIISISYKTLFDFSKGIFALRYLFLVFSSDHIHRRIATIYTCSVRANDGEILCFEQHLRS